MDGVHIVAPGQVDNAGNIEVGANRLALLADAISFIGLEAMQGKTILVGINGHRAHAQLMRRAEDANGDLATIGHQNLANKRRLCLRHQRWVLWSGKPGRHSRSAGSILEKAAACT